MGKIDQTCKIINQFKWKTNFLYNLNLKPSSLQHHLHQTNLFRPIMVIIMMVLFNKLKIFLQ